MHASNGILFNHESPRRGETFVTRKTTRGLARILAGKDKKLYLGNLDAERDWGYAKDYVEAMWLMLQQEQPDDYVIATGEKHSVRSFVDKVFSAVGLNWQDYVEFDARYLRPTEVDALLGDSSKARRNAGLAAAHELRRARPHHGGGRSRGGRPAPAFAKARRHARPARCRARRAGPALRSARSTVSTQTSPPIMPTTSKPAPNSSDTIKPVALRQAGIAEGRDHGAFAHAPAGDRDRHHGHQDHRRHQEQRVEQRQFGADRARRAPCRDRGHQMDQDRQAEDRRQPRAANAGSTPRLWRRRQGGGSATSVAELQTVPGQADENKTGGNEAQPDHQQGGCGRPDCVPVRASMAGRRPPARPARPRRSRGRETPNRWPPANWPVCQQARCAWRRRRRSTAASG